ncbi:hypothetical protein ACWGH8_38380 [Nonomuraea muscovyensis]|uniref:Uncharacterized protein n=1 Tax=Nonomuraea muscovyensis TaxID=1124761 RepID=A0A7X0C310_9ACTN|nr:hypothetical protein [Nonomuraea muscovyensis]MBB6346560.1 hypothetical protein [Nonomuraea muscovyensis]
MDPYDVTIDAGGRRASGLRYGTLADDHAAFTAELRAGWSEMSPLPYEEFAAPYLEFRRTLLEGCELLGEHLRHSGAGQVVMAEVNTLAERTAEAGIEAGVEAAREARA